MKYSIDLQSPFAFSPYWYALGIALIVLALLLRFGFNRLFAVKMDSPFRIDKLRRDCLRQVDKIENAYAKKKISCLTKAASWTRLWSIDALSALPSSKEPMVVSVFS